MPQFHQGQEVLLSCHFALPETFQTYWLSQRSLVPHRSHGAKLAVLVLQYKLYGLKFLPRFNIVPQCFKLHQPVRILMKILIAFYIDSFASSTIYRYLSTVMQFYATCTSMHIPPEGLTEIQFADILMAGRSSDLRVSSSMCIKSIRWAFKQFNIQCLQIVFGPPISSFTKEHVVSDRREALPYSLLTLVQWERRVLQSSATQQEVLGIGSFLLMMWRGMRFADLQRIRLSSLACDMTSLRGLSYRTKTCKSGCPFGLPCKGFLSTGSFTWVHRFLQEIDSLYSGCGKQPQDIDFIIPSTDALESATEPSPMTYAEAFFYCRHYLSLPWRKPPMDTGMNAHHYTVHGLKSTCCPSPISFHWLLNYDVCKGNTKIPYRVHACTPVMMSAELCSFRNLSYPPSRRAGDRTHH